MASLQGDVDERSDGLVVGEEADRAKAMDELWSLCNVLGITFKSKMAEFGSVAPSTERVLEAVRFLEVSRDNNYSVLKKLTRKISEAWGMYNTPMSRVLNFSWILSIRDAQNAEDLKDWMILSKGTVDKVKAEISKLTDDWENKIKRKYTAHISKYKKLLAETHLSALDLEHQVSEQVNAEDYKVAKSYVKYVIQDVKNISAERRELVLRVELARWAMNRKFPMQEINDMLKLAEKEVMNLKNNNGPLMYDGKDVESVLETIKQLAIQSSAADAAKEKQILTKTRSGRVA